MLERFIPDGIDVERLMNVYVSTRRRKMSKAIADGDDDITQVEVRDMIVKMENSVIDEMGGDFPSEAEPFLRSMAQQAIIDKLTRHDGKQEA